MSRRLNHRGWTVIDSVASRDGLLCVDIFEHPDATYGFEHFRSDPEDGGRWTAVGGFSSRRFESLAETIEVAEDAIPWLARSDSWSILVDELTSTTR